MLDTHSKSLSERLSKKISISLLTLIIIICISIFFGTYLFFRQTFNQQVKTWLSIVPQYSLSNLIDSDYFSIIREVDLLESTSLFAKFTITNNQKKVIAEFGDNNDLPMAELIPIEDDAKVIWGYYSYQANFNKFLMPFLMMELAILLLIIPIYLVAKWRLSINLQSEFKRFNDFLKEIESLTQRIDELDGVHDINKNLKNHPHHSAEQQRINNAVFKLIHEIQRSRTSLKQAILEREHKKLQAELSKTALQVAHDIRSPLAALEMIIQSTTSLPEDNRLLIRNAVWRITDIANTLLNKNSKPILENSGESNDCLSKTLLSSVVNMLITEKRLQYRTSANIEIENTSDSASYGLFSTIKIADFKRILSNLVNNAAEAIIGHGKITIHLSGNEKNAEIIIKDNGKGIPPHIMKQLGQSGMTYGKADGNGLGLYHAKTIVESWGGKLILESKVGKGTLVKICLPKVQEPPWFVSALEIFAEQTIVILDDDFSIHEIWKERIRQFKVGKNTKISLQHFFTPNEISHWLQQPGSKANKQMIYLCDYELIGYKETGLDIIKKFNINKQSILVTSHFIENDIVLQCEGLGVKMIPKDLASLIPINLKAQSHCIVDAILIDDDPFIHTIWEISANRHKKNIALFTTAQQLLNICNTLPLDTDIYIDSNLGSGIKGEIIAEDIYARGFKNIYLATGDTTVNINHVPWIKQIVDKKPPWE